MTNIQLTEAGIKKVKDRKAELKQPDGKKFTIGYLLTQATVSEDTWKRFIKQKEPKYISKDLFNSIIGVLELTENEDLIEGTHFIPIGSPNPPADNESVKTAKNSINWHSACREMLEQQCGTTSNHLMKEESSKKNIKQIYVPLGLVGKKKPDKRQKTNVSPDSGTSLYEPQHEIEQQFEHEAFLTQILEKGEGKSQGKRIALIGEPGAGKTTLLRTIANWVLEKELGLPVWIPLADLVRNENVTDIQTYINDTWLENLIFPTPLTKEVRDDFNNQIQQGKIWLLLDGADEMLGGKADCQPLEEINRQLTKWKKHSKVVLTCRLNVWQADSNELEDFETYRLLDFDYPQQVEEFIDNWFIKNIQNQDSEKGKRLKAELDSAERKRLQDLVQNPLRLSLLCAIWQEEEGNLPRTKAGLYARYVKYFYDWKKKYFQIEPTQQRKLNSALGRLSLRDIDQDSSRFRIRESFIVKQEFGEPDNEDSLFYKALKIGWLNHVGFAAESASKEKVYAFYHATFEEYFAATAIDDWKYFLHHVPDEPEKGSYKIFESEWREVILLWLGREDVNNKQKNEFIRSLITFESGCGDFYQYRAYFLAAAGIAEFDGCQYEREIVENIVKCGCENWNIFEDALKNKNKDTVISQDAQGALLQTNRKQAIAGLLKLIADSQDEYTRGSAAHYLGKIGADNEQAIAALLKLMADSQDRDTHWRAAYSLEKIGAGNEQAIAGLLKLMADSQDEYTRGGAAHYLGKIGAGNEQAIAGLVNLMADSQDEDTRRRAAESLGEIGAGNEQAIAGLVKLMADSQDKDTRSTAAESLGKIGAGNEQAIAGLLKLIADSQDEYTPRGSAASSLREIGAGNEQAIAGLLKLMADSQDEHTRWRAAHYLGEIGAGNEQAIAGLLKLMADSQDEHTRSTAAYYLGEIGAGNEQAIAGLLKLMADSQDDYTRWSAASSLGEIDAGNEQAIAGLVNLIADSQDEDTRWRAAYYLGEIDAGNEQAIAGLVNLMADSQDEDTRWRAAESLGEIGAGNEQAIAGLVNLMADSQDEDTRRRAAESLGKIGAGNEQAIAGLVNLMADSQDEGTRRRAASSLVEIGAGNEQAIAGLLKLMADSQDERTRRRAASSLVEIGAGNEQVIVGLLKLMADSQDKYIRRRPVYYFLKRIGVGKEQAIAGLLKLMADSQDEHTRSWAASSLREIGAGNEQAIAGLVNLMADSQDEDTRWRAAESLGKIGAGNEQAIAGLLKLMADSQDESTRWRAAESLGKIDAGNEQAITGLLNLMADSQDEDTRWRAAESLGKIGAGNEQAIAGLVNLMADSQDESTRRRAAESLGKIGAGNEQAIAGLLNLMADSQDESTRWRAAESLGKIITVDYMSFIIAELKNHSQLNSDAYKLIWNCAQVLSYHDFYRAWNGKGERGRGSEGVRGGNWMGILTTTNY